eukprot:TRINITY_DN22821_c0_g1_i1.p1 TRINITY_DN22821_c0_g1~~TRINITY_DN22821_c0_g1_i1.p1  ORF type:complete len:153 (+),score=3.18 TRINITY_DN22821_c0_g1_i1:300-758(+)
MAVVLLLFAFAVIINAAILRPTASDRVYTDTYGFWSAPSFVPCNISCGCAEGDCQAAWSYFSVNRAALLCESPDQSYLLVSAVDNYVSFNLMNGPSANNYTCRTTDNKYKGITLLPDLVASLQRGICGIQEEFKDIGGLICMYIGEMLRLFP